MATCAGSSDTLFNGGLTHRTRTTHLLDFVPDSPGPGVKTVSPNVARLEILVVS